LRASPLKERRALSGANDSLVVFLHGVGASGADLAPLAEPLSTFLPSAATPALLLHGEADAMVPAEESRRAATRLKAAGFTVEARFFARLGHSISGEGVEAAGAFLARPLTPA
jgi:predicted esterase